jgi:hypothetical protein
VSIQIPATEPAANPHGPEALSTTILVHGLPVEFRPSVTSDKVLVRQIRVNAILTSDKVKPELLCPRWLPRCCHGGCHVAATLDG